MQGPGDASFRDMGFSSGAVVLFQGRVERCDRKQQRTHNREPITENQ
jgi:hypothetical protein